MTLINDEGGSDFKKRIRACLACYILFPLIEPL